MRFNILAVLVATGLLTTACDDKKPAPADTSKAAASETKKTEEAPAPKAEEPVKAAADEGDETPEVAPAVDTPEDSDDESEGDVDNDE